jgi:hypothetical protein
VRARARLNADLDPRVAVGEHGFWQACAELGAPGYDPFGSTSASYNMLIGTAVRDPVSGTPSLRSYLCEIRLIAEEDGGTGTMSPIGSVAVRAAQQPIRRSDGSPSLAATGQHER